MCKIFIALSPLRFTVFRGSMLDPMPKVGKGV